MKPLTFTVYEIPEVKALCQLILDVFKDERIPIEVRNELYDKVEALVNRIGKE